MILISSDPSAVAYADKLMEDWTNRAAAKEQGLA